MQYIISILLFTAAFSLSANSNLPNNRHITVNGESSLTAKPDMAVIDLEVTSIKKTSLDAKYEVDNKVNKLLEGLKKFDILESEVSASRLLTQPQMHYGPDNQRSVSGYKASRSIKVNLNNLSHLNEFVNFTLKTEINEIRNIQITSSKADHLKQQAQLLAVKDAKQKAQKLAVAFDAILGKIYSINSATENHFHRYGANMERDMVQSTSAPGQYLQSTITFTASVNAVFDLEVSKQ